MMSDYLVPCIASFFLGVGVTLVLLGVMLKEPVKTGTDKAPAPEVVGYDREGKDK